MRDLIARLIDCGFCRETAVCIAMTYKRRNDLYGLERYVESVEDECREVQSDESVWLILQ